MGQTRLRIGYLLDRARSLRASNLVEFARQTKKVSRAPLPVIIADMLWCSVRYEMGFRDYAVWDIRLLSRRERETWMTHPKSYRLTKSLNSPESRAVFEDKVRFYREFSDVIGREWLDLRDVDAEAFAAFLERHPRIVVKPADGAGGAGVEMRDDVRPEQAAEVYRELREAGQDLVEEALPQHPDLDALYPGSVNTLRLITYFDPAADRVHLLASVLRIGNGAAIDNFASGGMYTMLDDEGRALYAGVDKNSNVYRRHPVSGVTIEGFPVPEYASVLSLVEDLARRVPDMRYIGWDIAVTPRGPAVIEGNHNSSVFQAKPTVSGIRTGLLPHYRRAIGF